MRLEQRSKAEISRLKALFSEVGLQLDDDPCPSRVKEACEWAEPVQEHREATISDACGKAIYTTESEARRVAKNRKRHGAGFLRVYFCSHCHGFHLTKSPKHVK